MGLFPAVLQPTFQSHPSWHWFCGASDALARVDSYSFILGFACASITARGVWVQPQRGDEWTPCDPSGPFACSRSGSLCVNICDQLMSSSRADTLVLRGDSFECIGLCLNSSVHRSRCAKSHRVLSTFGDGRQQSIQVLIRWLNSWARRISTSRVFILTSNSISEDVSWPNTWTVC